MRDAAVLPVSPASRITCSAAAVSWAAASAASALASPCSASRDISLFMRLNEDSRDVQHLDVLRLHNFHCGYLGYSALAGINTQVRSLHTIS